MHESVTIALTSGGPHRVPRTAAFQPLSRSARIGGTSPRLHSEHGLTKSSPPSTMASSQTTSSTRLLRPCRPLANAKSGNARMLSTRAVRRRTQRTPPNPTERMHARIPCWPLSKALPGATEHRLAHASMQRTVGSSHVHRFTSESARHLGCPAQHAFSSPRRRCASKPRSPDVRGACEHLARHQPTHVREHLRRSRILREQ